ncbi:MAG: peptide chain release factor N(5)-glutamine methyltransferase [Tannerellaceae bacterium]|jgi:release factor glutamine methyltransferase|nr:peptide chain release factor N(5)-glutamine methyltransferase [Tannerellaceae bacterium]
MTETVSYIHHSLKEIYPPGEIRSLTRLMLEHVCGLQPYQLLADKDRALSDAQKFAINRIVERLRQWEPVQYILGETTFCRLTFRVSPQVLIPRPETEELVERIVEDYAGQTPSILDIGTGSGCIAVSLAHSLPNAKVTALDVSAEALCIAGENAERNQVSVSFIQTDILSVEQASEAIEGMFDLIVSNPPYVRESEKACMEKNVLRYEPPLALYVTDREPLIFYRAIARLAKKKLKEGGALYFEINARLGKETIETLQEEGYGKVTLMRDMAGKDRIIKARR